MKLINFNIVSTLSVFFLFLFIHHHRASSYIFLTTPEEEEKKNSSVCFAGIAGESLAHVKEKPNSINHSTWSITRSGIDHLERNNHRDCLRWTVEHSNSIQADSMESTPLKV